ncbi:MAG: FG-GAP repeat protein, partial [Lewinellaceae bacterium]|nr:FG-GAP repeat protein [Lewinellaceae bacterium]
MLTYDKLRVWDATGKELTARMEWTGSRLDLLIEDAAATYPLLIDPTFSQQAYLKASNTGAGDSFGWSVAISGETIVVGAYLEESNATGVNGDESNNDAGNSGAAYVFVRSGTVWSQQAYLKASNTGANDQFGRSVAISGETLVVGAISEDSNATGVNGDATAQANNDAVNSGAAYVFVRSGVTWSQQAYLKASNTGANDEFGISVAISGETIVVGANGEDSNATGVNGDATAQANNDAGGSGAAYVFVRSGGTWSQQAYLKASNTGANDEFGISVAISGETIVVGANGEDSNATGVNGDATAQANNDAGGSGAAYVFVRSGVTWSQQAYLKASNTGANDEFGISVAISGATLVVGAISEDSNATGVNGDATAQANNDAGGSGAAYVFVRSGVTWSQQAYLKASNTGANDQFGISVAISGETIVVGANLEDSNATGVNGDATAQANNDAGGSGAAYVFVRSGVTWSQQAYLKASNTQVVDQFGISVAISGETLVVGAYSEDSNAMGVNGDATAQANNSANTSGAAYVFTFAPTCTAAISNISVPTAIALGGKLEFYAEATGGEGSCKLELGIRPLGSTDPFRFIASVSGVPDKTLQGSTTLIASEFPAGTYELQFKYDCDGDDCEAVVETRLMTIVGSPTIVEADVTPTVCVGERMDFRAQALGGSGSCKLQLEIRPKNPGNPQPYTFIASISGQPTLKLLGSTTLSANTYPPGTYEVRFSYTCDDALLDEVVLEIDVTPKPELKADAKLAYTVCSDEEVSVDLTTLVKDLPDGVSLAFADEQGNLVNNVLTKKMVNKTKDILELEYTVVPLACSPNNCLTDFRVGGQQGDNYIGPTCNGDGTYRTCIYLTGRNLPENIALYRAEINGTTYLPAFFQKLSSNEAVICFSKVVAQGMADVTLFIGDNCSLTKEGLYAEPDCGTPSNCLTDFRVGGLQGDAYVGPMCNNDGTYRTCFYLSGPNLPNDINAYSIEINGKVYPTAFFAQVGPGEVVVCATGIVAQGTADVTIAINGLCALTKTDLYTEPVCGLQPGCISDFRPGGQPGDAYIGPTCNNDGTYRTAFYVTGINLPANQADYSVVINGTTYPAVFFQVLSSTQVVIGVNNIIAQGMADVTINVKDGVCTSTIDDLYTEPSCPVPAMMAIQQTAGAGMMPAPNFENPFPNCCAGEPFTVTLYVLPELSISDTVTIMGVDVADPQDCDSYEMTLDVTVKNTGYAPLDNIDLDLNLSGPDAFGPAFGGILVPPAFVPGKSLLTSNNPLNSAYPTLVPYNGTGDLVNDATGLLNPGDSITIRLTILVHTPNAPAAIAKSTVSAEGNYEGDPLWPKVDQTVRCFARDATQTAVGDCPAVSCELTAYKDVTVTTGSDCDACITASMLIPNHDASCELPLGGYYQILIEGYGTFSDTVCLTRDMFQTEKVKFLVRSVACACTPVWGYLHLEDKTGPMDYDAKKPPTFECTEIDKVLNVSASWTNDQYGWYVAPPTFRDNCCPTSSIKVKVSDAITYHDCDYIQQTDVYATIK